MIVRAIIIILIAVFLFFTIEQIILGKKVKAIQEKLNACYEKEDYHGAIKLLLKYKRIPGMTLEIRGWYLIYTYFGLNDLKCVRHYRNEYYEQMILDSKGRLDIVPQMIELQYVLLLYLHGEVTEAAEIYGELAKNIEELEHRERQANILICIWLLAWQIRIISRIMKMSRNNILMLNDIFIKCR